MLKPITLEGVQVPTFFNYFVSPLVFPIYVGLMLYIFSLFAGRFFADVFIRQLGNEPNAVERGTMRAWKLLTILHLLFLSIFVLGLSVHALSEVSHWSQILLYLISYVPFLIIDVFVLISLASHGTKKKKR